MRFGFCSFSTAILTGIALVASTPCASAQETGSGRIILAAAQLPEAPEPQYEMASAEVPAQQGSSSSQAAAPQSAAGKNQHEKAEEQIKEQEKQRTVGIVPAFNVSYRSDAVSMSPGQKMRLAFRSSIDPMTFATGFLAAGYHESLDSNKGFGWGPEGYFELSGASYLDAFNGTIIGNGILPVILHQDPRYFRMGHGSTTHRLLFALSTSVICKHDNTGKWEPNYSNVAGNIASGAISNLYYPPSGSGISQTFSNGMLVTAEGGIGSIFQEFWPDISRKILHKDPTHGLDAQARAADKARKEARQKK
jgi:hypothetical protein